MFRKILIANRGEIAIRILRACREMGIPAAAVFSEADRASLHVRLADEAYPIGPAPSRESYLRIDKLMEVARRAGCDALHPGYGFLAENAELPRACADHGVTFIGPSPEAMEKLGSKTAARQLAKAAGVPTVPGTLEPLADAAAAGAFAREAGFPVLLKAVAGGGGKGMRRVENAGELEAAWRDASSEAVNAFGDGRLYIEKYLERPRHIEIQVFGDQHGNMVYLNERECSVQRRHQKVVEEAPSPVVDAALRRTMGEAAVRLARAGGYTNAGTVEFLVDPQRHFYFLEMNTRLQVEHPVTELVTGLDLVKMQIRAAAGEPLALRQEDVTLRGHAIECRIYAEDPDNNFFPSPGKIDSRRVPAGPGIRLDDGVYAGWVVPTDYDPLLGKLIAWGNDRAEAIARMRRALDEYFISGIQTNLNLFQRMLLEPEYVRGEIYTRWLDEWLGRAADETKGRREPGAELPEALETAAVVAAALFHLAANGVGAGAEGAVKPASGAASPWRQEGRRTGVARDPRE
ncbi:MAG TPA: acetyl-CoA carboxylase biotin carboxylase subunit [Candidatus Acidoferrales bacterium]|nr:acetyl-CoA carboxylase biotin carboxylase subunit [Candidatus Acidoferrales bacterium]